VGRVVDIYGGRAPRELPLYSVQEAATYLGVPSSTLRAWVRGQSYRVKSGRRRFRPLITPHASGLLTFNNFVEAYVLASLTRTFDVPLPSVRKALAAIGTRRPLLDTVLHTDGMSIFIEHLEEDHHAAPVNPAVDNVPDAVPRRRSLIDVSHGSQVAIREVLVDSLRRVDRDAAGSPMRVFPWLNRLDESQVVSVDPRRAFGRPTVAGTSVTVDVIAARYAGGDSRTSLRKDYALSDDQLDDVLRWGMHGVRASHGAQAA